MLDPFFGSGTTAKVSLENRRKCVGHDISSVFVENCYQKCGQVNENVYLLGKEINFYLH